MDELTRLVDGRAQIGIGDRADFMQGDRTAEHVSQSGGKIEIQMVPPQAAIGTELDQKVGVACGRIEILAPCRRSENLKANDVVASAERRQFFPSVSNGVVQ